MKTIVVCCAYAMATSSMLEISVQDFLKRNQLEGKVVKLTFQQVAGYVESHQVDLIIPNGRYQCPDVPVISGIPYLTGVGIPAMEKKILSVLQDNA